MSGTLYLCAFWLCSVLSVFGWSTFHGFIPGFINGWGNLTLQCITQHLFMALMSSSLDAANHSMAAKLHLIAVKTCIQPGAYRSHFKSLSS